jgi:hypothetical protein
VDTKKGWGESERDDWDKTVEKARFVVCFRGFMLSCGVQERTMYSILRRYILMEHGIRIS